MTPIRLTVVLTHPIQYYASWFRYIAQHAPEIALTVVHAVQPNAEQQGVGFDHAFTWDVPLTSGYQSVTVRGTQPEDRVDSGHFWGLDVPQVSAAVEQTRPDVVLVTGWYSITLVRALRACRRLGVPVLYRGDSHLLSGPRGWKRPLWFAKAYVLLREFDGFLSPGTRVDEYLRHFGAHDYRIFHVPHGVDNELFATTAARYKDRNERAKAREAWGIPPDDFVPVFVGKLIGSKRPLNVARAVARLGGGTTLLVVGAGPLRGELEHEAKRLGIRVKLVGFVNQTELGRAYAVADCLTLPSDFPETWGLVVNEALATGLPVVVSDAVGCAPDLVKDGETGYVYPLDNIEQLTDRLELVRRRKARCHDWAPACLAMAASHSYPVMTEGLQRACRSVLPRSVGAPATGDTSQRIIALCGQMVIAGGLERMFFYTLETMVERGAGVHCIVNDWESFRITRMADEIGATWSAGPYHYSLTRRNLGPLIIYRMLREIWRVSANLIREARRFRPTHVLVPDYQAVIRNAPALVLLRALGTRVIVSLQNAPVPGRFYGAIWRWFVDPFTDSFVCNSDFTKRELLAHALDHGKVRVIPNVVSPRADQWQTNGSRRPGRIIYVGQIIPEKGLDRLLEAVSLLRRQGRTATLDVVGDIGGWEAPEYRGYHQRIRERAAQTDLAGAVNFLGWREDVPTLMSEASVHCCPSLPEIREAFGLVVLEAKLSGIPSVVVPSGHLPNLIEHRRDGWVCASATPEAIADGLEFFLADPSRLEAAGRAAEESARAFDPAAYRSAWREVFA